MQVLSPNAQSEYQDNIALSRRIASGDRNAFSVVFKKYHQSLFSFAEKLSGDADYANDIVQEAFIRLWNSRQRLKPEMGIRNYIYMVLLNIHRDHQRQRSRINYIDCDIDSLSSPDFDNKQGDEGSPLEKLLRKCLCTIHEDDRAMLFLIKTGGLSYPEVATIFGIHTRTVRRRIDRIIDSIVRAAATEGYILPGRTAVWLLL